MKRLKQMQNDRSKSEERETQHEHPLSYAQRLKAVTSPHIKLIQKLSYINKTTEPSNKKRNFNNTPNVIKSDPRMNETTNGSTLVTDENKRLQTNPTASQRQSMKTIKSAIPKLFNYSEQSKNAEEQNVKLKSEDKDTVIQNESSTSEISYRPKAYKNEGCQARPSNSVESIDSNTVVRFPTNLAIKVKEQQRKTLCEKSLQTEANSTPRNTPRQMTPVSKIQDASLKKIISNKKLTVSNEGKDIKKPKNNQFKNIQPKKPNASDKLKGKPSDEKANVILNDIISKSNIDIRKLYTEIGRVQKTSPFARHHTVFERRSPEEIKKEHSSYMKNNPNRAPGTIILPDHKRKEYLAQIKKRQSELLKELNSIPVNAKSAEARQQKLQIGQALDTMDSAIKMFSKNQLLIDLNPTS
ncbi:uncharacterized protein LOC142317917 [Lycorma delicatula]|uniref:uncharacterized protein LOC142317917 n=1 Tax=Lycorma delicatula TaxID=130591 RepID=UPI003F5164F6